MKRGTKQEKLEKQRRTFFLIGLIIALGLSFAAFEWKTYDYSLSDLIKVDFAWVDEEFVEPTQHKKPNVPLPVVKPVVSIKEVDNEAMVDEDIEFFDPESVKMWRCRNLFTRHLMNRKKARRWTLVAYLMRCRSFPVGKQH